MKSLRSVMVFSLALALFQLLQANPAAAVTMDDFSDNTRSVIWTNMKVGTGAYAAEKNKRVEFRILPGATGVPPFGQFYAEYLSRFQMKGDFDIAVDFRAIDWPLQSGVSVGIKVSVDSQTPVCGLARTSLASGELIAFANASRVSVATLPTSAVAGKLKLKRIGNTLTAYCSVPETSNQWHELGSITLQDAPPLTVELAAGSVNQIFSHHKVVASLDNFVINKGFLLWP